MAFNAGEVFVKLGALFEKREFDKYDRAIAKARREPDVETKLKADYDGRGFQLFHRDSQRASNGLVQLASRIPLVKWGAISIGATGAAIALGGLASAVAPVVGLLGAIPGPASAAVEGISAVGLATKGVGEAIKAGADAQTTAGKDAQAAAQQHRTAAESIRDAQHGLASAHRAEERAQEDLTRARKDAERQLEDLKFASEGARISSRRATMELQEARRELNRVQSDPDATARDIQEAELRLDEAKLGVREARTEAKRASGDYDEARRKGIKGSDQYKAAQEGLAEAHRAVGESARNVKLAQENAARAASQGAAGADKYREALKKLSPEAQHFVGFILGLKPQLDSLRAAAGRRLFPGLEDGISSALKNAPVFERSMERMGGAIGNVARRFGRMLGSSEWGKDLETQSQRNAVSMERWGHVAESLANVLRHVTIAAGPMVDLLEKSAMASADDLEAKAKQGRETGKLEKFFLRAYETGRKLWHILRDTAVALFNIGKIQKDVFGDDLLNSIEDAAAAFRKWTESAKGKNDIRQFFEGVKHAAQEVHDYIDKHLIQRFKDLKEEGKSTGEALSTIIGEQIGEAVKLAVEQVGKHAPDIAAGLVNGFLAANVWGKIFLGAWFLKKLGLGRAIGAVVGRAGGNIAESLAGGLNARLGRAGTSVRRTISNMFARGRAGVQVAASAGATMAGDFAGSMASGLKKHAGNVRSIIRRQMLAGRLAGAAAVDAGSAMVGTYVGSLATGMRKRAGDVRSVIRRNLLGGRLAGGAAEGGAAAVAGVFVGGLAGSIRKKAGGVRDIIRRRLLGGAAVGGAVEGAAAAVAGLYASTIGGHLKKTSAKGGKFFGALTAIGRLWAIPLLLGLQEALKDSDPAKNLSPMPESSEGNPGKKAADWIRGIFGVRATGGGTEAGETTLVGEEGPEIARFPTGTAISTASQTLGKLTPDGRTRAKGLAATLEDDRKKAMRPIRGIDDDLQLMAKKGLEAGRKTARNVTGQLDKAGKESKKISKKLAVDVGDQFEDLRRGTEREMRRTVRIVDDKFGDIRVASVRAARRTGRGVGDEYRDMQRGTERVMTRMVRTARDRFTSMQNSGTQRTRDMSKNVRGSMVSLDRAVFVGLDYIGDATKKSLGAFTDKPKFKWELPRPKLKATGAWVGDPGDRGRDEELVMMGKGEAVLTGWHQRPADTAFAIANMVAPELVPYRSLDDMFGRDKRTHSTAPGMASGGLKRFALGGPGHSGSGFTPVWNLARSKFHMTDYTGKDGHSTYTSTGNVSDHTSGHALDMSMGTSSPTPQLDGLNAFFKRKVPQVVKQLIWRGKDQFRGFPISDHFNHVHLAMPDQYAFNAERMAKIISRASRGLDFQDLLRGGGGGGGEFAVDHVDKVKVKGPAGPMMRIAQGALDKTRDSANKWLDEQASKMEGASGVRGNFPDVHGSVSEKEARQLWVAAGGPKGKYADLAARIMVCESGGDPNAVSSTGCTGLWQICPPPADAKDPKRNAIYAVGKWNGNKNFSDWSPSVGCWGGYARSLGLPAPTHFEMGGRNGDKVRMNFDELARMRKSPRGRPVNDVPNAQTPKQNRRNLLQFAQGGMAKAIRRFQSGGSLGGITAPTGPHGGLFPRPAGGGAAPKAGGGGASQRWFGKPGLNAAGLPSVLFPTDEIGGRHIPVGGDRLRDVLNNMNRKIRPAARRLTGYETSIEDIGTDIDRHSAYFDQSEEQIVLSPGDRGFNKAVAKRITGSEEAPYIDNNALQQRSRELRMILDLHLKRYDKYNAWVKTIENIANTIRGARDRLSKLSHRKGLNKSSRKRYGDAIKKLNNSIQGYKNKIKEVRGGRAEAWTEGMGIQRELQDLLPAAQFELGQAKTDDSTGGEGAASPAEIAAAAAEQLRGFQANRADLFGSFGRNFVARGQNPFLGAIGQGAGMRFFGGAGGSGSFISAAGGGGAGLSGFEQGGMGGSQTQTNVYLHQHFPTRPDEHTWARGTVYELEGAM